MDETDTAADKEFNRELLALMMQMAKDDPEAFRQLCEAYGYDPEEINLERGAEWLRKRTS